MVLGNQIFKKSCKIGAVLGFCVTVAACSATFQDHGYAPPEEELDNVIIGVDTRDTVADVIGSPVSRGVLEGGDWYFVQSRWRHYAYKQPVEIEREVLAIRFDTDGVVTNIERFGLEDGEIVVLSRRVTESNIKNVGFLQQMFGSFGNINAGSLLGDS